MSRLQTRFAQLKQENRAALVTFVTAGDPDYASSLEILKGLPAAGADVIELGMPFTDPMADGPAIQLANIRALDGGQTLAMKTWHVRLVRQDGLPPTLPQATARALLSWLWFGPALAVAWTAQWHQGKPIGSLLALWVVAYAVLSFFLPQRQFLHDVLCRTRVIDTRP